MENKKKKHDILLIGGLLAAALLFYGGIRLYQWQHTLDAVAVVTVKGEEYGRYPLNQDMKKEIKLSDGSVNILEIKDGKADMIKASCPDKICVNHRPVGRKGETIVCLPNEVVVEIENGEVSDVDSSTN